MNAAERMAVIRAKCRHQPVEAPKAGRKPGLIVRGSGRPTAYGIGPKLIGLGIPEWIQTGGEQNPGLRAGHRHGAHWLTKVAEKWRK